MREGGGENSEEAEMRKHRRREWTVAAIAALLVAVCPLWAAENGQNKFVKIFGTAMPDPVRTVWDLVYLPDLNDNGAPEILVACDAEDGSGGADFYIYERADNDRFEVVWHYRAADCNYEFGAGYGDADNDGRIEVILCLNVGQGQNGLRFFEVDPTIEGFPLPDFPTSEIDLHNGVGADIDAPVATWDLDKDGKNELIVLETRLDEVWVLEETTGDISFPDFKVEMRDSTIGYSPWGLAIGDFDNDGYWDFAVGEYDYNGLIVYENVGADQYAVRFYRKLTYPYADGVSLRSLLSYDFNGDGFAELVYPTYSDTGIVFIVTNPGEVAEIDSTHIHPVAVLNSRLAGADVGDQDFTGPGHDGRDIYIASRDDRTLYDIEYIGGPNGDVGNPANWVVYPVFQVAQRFQDVTTGDFDMDGRREIAIGFAGSSDPEGLIILEHEPLPNFGVQAVWHDPTPQEDPNDPIKGNPRGFWVGSDVDRDGKKEIFATQYSGRIVGYEVVRDNTLELIWVDSTAKAVYTGSQPRHVVVGDFDGNGIEEIIFHMGGAVGTPPHADSVGFYFFEWNGSDNGFGAREGGPTYILPDNQINPEITNTNATEFIWIADVDGDGRQELLLPSNGSGTGRNADFFTIVSCVDGTLESGFPVIKMEGFWDRPTLGIGGSPIGAIAADYDGDGVQEPVFLPWDLCKIVLFDAVRPDSFVFRTVRLDTTGPDGVFYVSVGHYDIDGDGAEEFMGAMYDTPGWVFLVNVPTVNEGGLQALNPRNPRHVAKIREAAGGATFNNVLGDLNGDGKAELFFCNYTRGQVNALAYNGVGDIMDPASWVTSEGFYDNSFVPKPKRQDYPDSASWATALREWNDGDISLIHGSFGLKMADDLDGDGKKELVISTIQSYWSKTWLWVLEAGPTGVQMERWRVITPSDYELAQNYPNPFNASTTIEYTLPLDKRVTIKVYNSLGQVVKVLVNDQLQSKGRHRVVWDGTDSSGKPVASGTYLYSLEVGNVKHTKKMTLVK